MLWFVAMHLFSALLDLIRIGGLSEDEKDLEILLLRRQLGIAERKLQKPVRASRTERLTIAVVTSKLRSSDNRTAAQLRQVTRLKLAKRKMYGRANCDLLRRNVLGMPMVA